METDHLEQASLPAVVKVRADAAWAQVFVLVPPLAPVVGAAFAQARAQGTGVGVAGLHLDDA